MESNYKIVEKGKFFVKKRTKLGWRYIRTWSPSSITLSVIFISLSFVTLLLFLSTHNQRILGVLIGFMFLFAYVSVGRKREFDTIKEAEWYIKDMVVCDEIELAIKEYKKNKI